MEKSEDLLKGFNPTAIIREKYSLPDKAIDWLIHFLETSPIQHEKIAIFLLLEDFCKILRESKDYSDILLIPYNSNFYSLKFLKLKKEILILN